MSSTRSRPLFSLSCGCRDSKSVSVSVSVSASDTFETMSKEPPSSAATATTTSTTTTATTTVTTAASLSPPSYYEDAASSSTPSFSGLLRELSELEKNVMDWAPPIQEQVQEAEKSRSGSHRRHMRCRSEGGGGRVEEGVAVVKESEDPLADFRRSMLQMIVENEIVDGESLRELLRRFLQLNSRRHHDLIIRAFAEIWNDVFSGYENTPDLLRRSNSTQYSYRPR